MNLPCLKHRADGVNALANLGSMPAVLVSTLAYYQLMSYDVFPPAPGDFRFVAHSLGVERMGHALRDRSLGVWMRHPAQVRRER